MTFFVFVIGEKSKHSADSDKINFNSNKKKFKPDPNLLDKDNFIESVQNDIYESFGNVRTEFSKDPYSFRSLQLNPGPITDRLNSFFSPLISCGSVAENTGEGKEAKPSSTAGGSFMNRVLKMGGQDLENQNSVGEEVKVLDCSLENLTTFNEEVFSFYYEMYIFFVSLLSFYILLYSFLLPSTSLKLYFVIVTPHKKAIECRALIEELPVEMGAEFLLDNLKEFKQHPESSKVQFINFKMLGVVPGEEYGGIGNDDWDTCSCFKNVKGSDRIPQHPELNATPYRGLYTKYSNNTEEQKVIKGFSDIQNLHLASCMLEV